MSFKFDACAAMSSRRINPWDHCIKLRDHSRNSYVASGWVVLRVFSFSANTTRWILILNSRIRLY
jgi:hypothetical protein